MTMTSLIVACSMLALSQPYVPARPAPQVKVEQPSTREPELFPDKLMMEYGGNGDVILDDIPGRLAVAYTNSAGKRVVQTFGDKVLRAGTERPKVEVKPILLRNSVANRKVTASLGYLAFISTGMTDEHVTKYRVERTATSKVSADDVDWVKVRSRTAELRKSPHLPADATFFVVQVAAVINVQASVFHKSDFKANAAGFGITAEGSYFKQISDESVQLFTELTPLFDNPFEQPLVAGSGFDPAKFISELKASRPAGNSEAMIGLSDKDIERIAKEFATEIASTTLAGEYSNLKWTTEVAPGSDSLATDSSEGE